MEINNKKQLGLDLKLQKNYDLKNFYFGKNEFLLSALFKAIKEKNSFSYFYIWGDKDSGKTHLLKGLEELNQQLSFYIDAKKIDYSKNSDIFFKNCLKFDFLYIDNLNAYNFSNQQWEMNLFNLFNDYKSKNKKLIISANCAINSLNLKLPDLKSRLTWGIVHKLIKLTDEEKLKVLQLYAKNRLGLILKSGIIEYILKRAPRSMESLFNVLEKLAKASIEEQKKISKPFIKQTMRW